jgi:glutaconate CoA-transferase subunit B
MLPSAPTCRFRQRPHCSPPTCRAVRRFKRPDDLFDFAAQGRLDGFFLSPGQIDGSANINLVGTGTYPNVDVRWPGSHGSPLLYMTIPNVILFRPDHKRRTFVERVDFISAPGVSPPNVYRPGGPSALITSLGYFSFDRASARFRLEGVHPGRTLDEIVENTGFSFDLADAVPATPAPGGEMIDALRSRVAAQAADSYPRFAAQLQQQTATYRSASAH